MMGIEKSVRLILLLGVCAVHGVLKDMDDSVMFRIDWRLESTMPSEMHSVETQTLSKEPFVFVSSGQDEKYLCAVPDISAQSKRHIESYSGPSPSELLRGLYEEKICSYWLDMYWTYELCHGRYVLQYHDDKDTMRAPRSEFYLGNFRQEHVIKEQESYNQLSPPTRKVDGVHVPFYPVTYRQGTVCDVTGKPRTTTVIYVCRMEAKDQVYSLAEIASCTYELVVLTKRICKHPSFMPITTPQHEIVCYSTDPLKESAKPNALSLLEHQRLSAFQKEYTLISSNAMDMSMNKNDEQHDTTLIIPKQQMNIHDASIKGENGSDSAEKEDTESILAANAEFLRGNECLYGGGTGWWKFEFCYGKRVVQYHEEPHKSRVEIILGTFNEEIHKHWIRQNAQKQPLKLDGKVLLVSHLYTGGDPCDEDDFVRTVEVRLRCPPTERSESAVSLYLLEPKTCQYVLVVEAPRFCLLLKLSDRFGLLPPPASLWKTAH